MYLYLFIEIQIAKYGIFHVRRKEKTILFAKYYKKLVFISKSVLDI